MNNITIGGANFNIEWAKTKTYKQFLEHFKHLFKELTEDENVFPYFITVAHVLNDRVSYTSVHVDKEQPIEVQEELVAQIMTIMNVIEQHYESNE